jgi:hypothetical protein
VGPDPRRLDIEPSAQETETMPIALIGAGIAAAGSIGGALISSSATNSAAGDAANAAAANNALQSQIYQSNKGLETPYINIGDTANTELQGFLGLGGSQAASTAALNTYLNSTGYQFNRDQGIAAITGDKAAAGLLNSGSTLQALDTFGTNLADQYGQQYVGNLQNAVGTGVSAANALAGEGENYANQVSSNNNNAASAAGNAAIANASTLNGAIANAFNAFGAARGQSSFQSGAGTGGNAFLGG